jgi:hypothetical protein
LQKAGYSCEKSHDFWLGFRKRPINNYFSDFSALCGLNFATYLGRFGVIAKGPLILWSGNLPSQFRSAGRSGVARRIKVGPKNSRVRSSVPCSRAKPASDASARFAPSLTSISDEVSVGRLILPGRRFDAFILF